MGDGGGPGGPGGIGDFGDALGDSIGMGQGEPGGAGNIGGIGAQGMSGSMAGDFGPGVGGPDGGGPADVRNQFAPRRQQQQQRPAFQINPTQVQNDMNMSQWGSGYQAPIMNPIAYENQMYANQAPPINWGGFFNLFGGK